MKKPAHPIVPYLLVLIACASWGGNWVTARWIMQEVSPFAMIFWRCAAATLLALAVAAPRLREDALALRAHWPMLALLGVLSTSLFSTFGYWGVRYTTATNAAIIGGAGPFVQAVLSWMVLRLAVTPLQMVGMTVSLAGALAIVSRGDWSTFTSLAFNPGDIILLGGVLTWQTYTVLLPNRPKVRASSFLFVCGLAGTLSAFPGYAWELASGSSSFPLTADVLLAAAYLVVFPAFVAFFCWVIAVAMIGPNVASFFNPLIPTFGVLGAVLFLGETLHPYHVAGFLLVLAGLVLVSIRRRSPTLEASAARTS